MQELVQVTLVFSRSFSMPCASFSMLDSPEFHRDLQALKMMHMANSSKLNKFLHCDVNQLIQQIIVQDQDGQNNNSQYMK